MSLVIELVPQYNYIEQSKQKSSETIMNEEETFNDIQSEIIARKKLRQRHTDQIEPWMDEPQTIPIYLLKTESEKFAEKQLRIRRHASMEIYSKFSSLSPRRTNRQSKELPRKDIGNFTVVKMSVKSYSSTQASPRKRERPLQLPRVSVTRELAIQRKLFLMKKKESSVSPRRSSIRSIVESRRKG